MKITCAKSSAIIKYELILKKNIHLVAIVVLSLVFTGDVLANVEFTINEHQTKVTRDAEKNISKEELLFEIPVDIGENYFSYTKDDTKYIYDFAEKRIFTIDLLSKTFSNDSLYSNIGFRIYEFENRLLLGGALAAGKIEDNPMLPVLSEHIFSLQQKDKKSELSKVTKKNTIYFSAAGKELISYALQGEKVSRNNKDMFIKLFRYMYGGHPQILDDISSSNVIPGTITFHRYNIVDETSALTISPVKHTPKRPFSLAGYSQGVLAIDKDPFSKQINEIELSATLNVDNYLKTILTKADKYYRNENYLDAMLAYFEYNLSSGLPMPAVFQEQKTRIFQDELVNLLVASITPKSKDEAIKYIANLQSIEKQSKYQKHVVNIFEANIQKSIGKHSEAKMLLQSALKISPYIASAYNDLGGFYFVEYNTIMAWRCWDVARKIAPSHKLLDHITESESRLYKEYPAFF